jgi:hypothetical protein
METAIVSDGLPNVVPSALPRGAAVTLAALLTLAAPLRSGHAAVSVSTARTELLYSQNADPDCSKLHAVTDDSQLPFYVTRLRGTVDNAPAGVPIVYRWSLPSSAKGLLASDLDLPAGQTPAVSGMCADFGNACVLTADKQRFYNEPTIFFLAPTCDVLPNDTSKPFKGGKSKIKLQATAGKKKLGHVAVTVGWGRNGVVVMYVRSAKGMFDDGIRKPNGVNTSAATIVAANITQNPSPGPTPLRGFLFDGAGVSESPEINSCPPFPQFNACAELFLQGAGRSFPTVEARYMDGSTLCDKITVRVGTCAPDAKLQVIPKPKRSTYDPADPQKSTVDLTVRLKNASHQEGSLPACNFLLRGANALSCVESINVGGVKDTKTTQFDFKHCSQTADQPCLSDRDCSRANCGTCSPGEICLAQNHCSQTFTHVCANDLDCVSTGQNPTCRECQPDETCIHVLQIPPDSIVPPGQSVDLVHQTVLTRNQLPDTASVKDTWKANVFIPQVSASKGLKYQVRGRP